ncbi:hypothetical protein P4O66_015662 [Electrophorus voltai]|uniref:Uncharacterized protein n=1 Tax=Electrophorus voltai TaxID=2609070 RepID=A0AAD8YZS6_9TELE|nr:hypothetical protein P4O66_015662 [Electrophorus voltai]
MNGKRLLVRPLDIEYPVLPYGPATAPSIFQAYINGVLREFLNHLYCKLEKCEFHRKGVSFLGYVICKGSLFKVALQHSEYMMSGGPPRNQKNLGKTSQAISELFPFKLELLVFDLWEFCLIEVCGGVTNVPLLSHNNIQGDVKYTFRYNGPPMTPTGGADNVQQREQNVGDNLINIRNEGGILNQPTFEDNVCAGAVNLEAEINIQHPHMEENKDQMDLK